MMVMRSVADSGDRRPSRRSRSYSATATTRHSTKDVRESGRLGVSALPADYRVELCVIFWHLAPLRCRGTIPMTTRSVQRASAAGYDTPSTRRRSNLKANGFESVAGERYDRRVPDPKLAAPSIATMRARFSTEGK